MEYIGLAVDDSLNWDEQYKSVKGKGQCCLASLGKTKNHHATIDMYREIEESHLWYAYPIVSRQGACAYIRIFKISGYSRLGNRAAYRGPAPITFWQQN